MSDDDLDAQPLGVRLTVRHRRPDGAATDTVGVLHARDADSVTLHGRRGVTTVPRSAVIVVRRIREVPWRVGRFFDRAGIAVFDLDGVVRRFDASGRVARAARALEVEGTELLRRAFALPEADAMITGRLERSAWIRAFGDDLRARGLDRDPVTAFLRTFEADHGTLVPETVEVLASLERRDVPVYLFTNGTDTVRSELAALGLDRLLPRLVNSAETGWAKPAPEAYAVAHAMIEDDLGRRVGTGEVFFTDDRPANVHAAREFGWQGRVFTRDPSRAES